MPKIKQTMFREYDLRGRETDDELNEKSMYFIGRGFGTYLRRKDILEAIVLLFNLLKVLHSVVLTLSILALPPLQWDIGHNIILM